MSPIWAAPRLTTQIIDDPARGVLAANAGGTYNCLPGANYNDADRINDWLAQFASLAGCASQPIINASLPK